jgi:hypothetical protein
VVAVLAVRPRVGGVPVLRLENVDDAPIDFRIDHAASLIEGYIPADEPGTIYWGIWIECLETTVPYGPGETDPYGEGRDGYVVDCNLELTGLRLPVAHWRDLAGRTVETAYAAEDLHPIMPGSDGNFYFLHEHHVPNHNRIRFGDREASRFALEWDCVAERWPGEDGPRIVVRTRLPLRRFRVGFRRPEAVSLDAARQWVLQFANPADLGEPEQTTPGWVEVPVRPDAA